MKPVLTFTPQMFAAAKALRKDITRRVATIYTDDFEKLRLPEAIHAAIEHTDTGIIYRDRRGTPHPHPFPYGPPGTTLPMATTWAAAELYDSKKPREMEGVQSLWFDDGTPKPGWAGKNRPARFLPKSLYLLAPQVEIVSTRAEPLQTISEEDAKREGAEAAIKNAIHGWTPHVLGYCLLWNEINEQRNEGAYVWDNNPIVWRIEFKLLS